MNRWHKAPNKLRDRRVTSMTPATRGVLMFIEELLAADPVLEGNITEISSWVHADRKVVRAALEAIQMSGYLLITSIEEGKSGTVYTVKHTPTTPQAHPDQAPTKPQAYPNHAPDESSIDAGLPSASLNRVDKKRVDNTPLPPKGDEVSDVDLLPGAPKRTHRAKTEPSRFDELWAIYPNRKGKEDARRAWVKLNPDAALVEVILAVVGKAKTTRDWLKDEGQYVPMCSTFLNKRRWEDYEIPSNLLTFRQKSDKPWAEAIEKYIHPPHVPGYTAPDEVAVMNLADEVGADPYKARELCRAEGLEAAASWALANGKEAAG